MNSSSSPHLPPAHDSESDVVGKDVRTSTRARSVWSNVRFLGFLAFLALVLVPAFFKMSVTSWLFSLLTFGEVVLLFNILIIVHELGHFLAARKCGLIVDKFAIWFGKPIWSKKVDGVEYILGSIPAGGYVALPQMAPMETIEGKTDTPQARNSPPPRLETEDHRRLRRSALQFFDSPSFSPPLVVWLVGQAGHDVHRGTRRRSASPFLTDMPAYKAGIRGGDVLKSISINGRSGATASLACAGFASPGGSSPAPRRVDAPSWWIEMEKPMTFRRPARDGSSSQKNHHWWERSVPRRKSANRAGAGAKCHCGQGSIALQSRRRWPAFTRGMRLSGAEWRARLYLRSSQIDLTP